MTREDEEWNLSVAWKTFISGLDSCCPPGNRSARVLRGEVVVIIGPSGSRKSTLLRSDQRPGTHPGWGITVDGIRVQEQKNLVPLRREVGLCSNPSTSIPISCAAECDFGTAQGEGDG